MFSSKSYTCLKLVFFSTAHNIYFKPLSSSSYSTSSSLSTDDFILYFRENKAKGCRNWITSCSTHRPICVATLCSFLPLFCLDLSLFSSSMCCVQSMTFSQIFNLCLSSVPFPEAYKVAQGSTAKFSLDHPLDYQPNFFFSLHSQTP